jgi:hypothetical protein
MHWRFEERANALVRLAGGSRSGRALFNSSITRIRYSGGRRSLAVFNSVPHLERPGYTHMLTYR